MRIFLAVLFLVAGIVTLFFDKEIFEFGIRNNISWTLSKLLPWLIVLLTSVVASMLLKGLVKSRRWRVTLLIGLPILLLLGMFARNPIYTGDYVKKGDSLNIESHELISIVQNYKKGFNGLVAIVDYHCPFCKKATREILKSIAKRNSKIDLALTLNTADSSVIKRYTKETNSSELSYISHPPSSELIELTKGVFPTFVYVKNGRIIHKWKNSELGYPALDWIESGME